MNLVPGVHVLYINSPEAVSTIYSHNLKEHIHTGKQILWETLLKH